MREIMWDKLVSKAKEGNKFSMEEIIERLRPLLISSIRRYYNKPNEYDDLIQDGVICILESIKDFDESKEVHFLGYIQSKLKYLYLNKHKVKFHLSLNEPIGDNDGEIMDLLVSDSKDTIELIIEDETNNLIRESLDKLTERQREIILLFYMENMSMYEIADKLGISYRTVVNLKTTAVNNLKKWIR